eukprot:scaffold57254_cov24-Tisochrysis_lutea.AAC.2
MEEWGRRPKAGIGLSTLPIACMAGHAYINYQLDHETDDIEAGECRKPDDIEANLVKAMKAAVTDGARARIVSVLRASHVCIKDISMKDSSLSVKVLFLQGQSFTTAASTNGCPNEAQYMLQASFAMMSMFLVFLLACGMCSIRCMRCMLTLSAPVCAAGASNPRAAGHRRSRHASGARQLSGQQVHVGGAAA